MAFPVKWLGVDFLRRTATRVIHWFRTLQIVKWLSDPENVGWVSVITRPPSAARTDFPPLNDYHGLGAIFETHDSEGLRWHFVWKLETAASLYEDNLIRAFGISGGKATRYAIRSAQIRRVPWWRRLTPWGIATGLVAGLAAIAANVDQISNSFLQWKHAPEMTLETTDTLQISSDQVESKTITLRGDPFFRARLSDLSMQIQPDKSNPNIDPKSLPRDTMVGLPFHRSVDVGDKLELILPFKKISAGRYLVKLRGRVRTSWRKGVFAPKEPLRLDVRPAYFGAKGKIEPWSPVNADPKNKFREAIVEIQLTFGRPSQSTLNLRVSLDGAWSGWEIVDPLPGGSLERTSQNTAADPKAVVFGLRNFPTPPFSTHILRLRLQAANALSAADWPTNIGELYVGLLD
jgi:hypothetical protein